MRRVLAQARKELTQLRRDWRTLGLAVVLPVVLLLLMSSAISFTPSRLPITVQDLDASPASRDFIDAFRGSLAFYVAPWPSDRQPDEALKSGVAYAALIIPQHFGRDVARGMLANVQLLVDASDSNTAKLCSGYAARITSAYNEKHSGLANRQLVRTAIRLWFNPGLSEQRFFGPGIFVLGLSMFPPLLASLAMAKESEQKTIFQVYVSNISAREFLLGKVVAFMCVTGIEALIMLVLLLTVFGLHFAGDPTPFIAATVLYAFCVASFGTMVGTMIPSQVAAIQAVAFGGFLLVFLLSGLMFPVENIPVGIRWLSSFIWGRYYIEIVRDALLQGGGWAATWYKVGIIGLIGSVFYLLAWRNMRNMQVKS